jgi:hypothetical protein
VNTAIAPLLQSKCRAGRVTDLWSFGHFPSASLPVICCKHASQMPTLATKRSMAVLSPREFFGGIIDRLYARRASLAFKAILTLPRSPAFSAILNGSTTERPCCHGRFVDA